MEKIIKPVKVTSLELAEAVGNHFDAKVVKLFTTSVRLLIKDKLYSIKTPVDFTANRIQEADVLVVRVDIHGGQVGLVIIDIYENGRKLHTNERK